MGMCIVLVGFLRSEFSGIQGEYKSTLEVPVALGTDIAVREARSSLSESMPRLAAPQHSNVVVQSVPGQRCRNQITKGAC